MIKRLLFILVVFLLAFSTPIYADSVKVDVYGVYNYEAKALSVFWKNPTITYSSYIIELNKVTLGVACGGITHTLLETTPTTGNNLTYSNLEPGYYMVLIKGVNAQGASVNVFSKDLFITVSSISFKISWCYKNPEIITDTIVFITETPTFEFTNSISVPEYKQMSIAKETSYFTVLNMVFQNKSTVELSEPSGQVIVYSAIPYKPTWQGIRGN